MEQTATANIPAGNHAKALLALLRGDHFPSSLSPPAEQSLQAPVASELPVAARAVKVYPNPANDRLYIRHLPAQENSGTLRLIDRLGRIVLEQPFFQSPNAELDISSLTDGIYFLEVSSAVEVLNKVQRIIINH